MYNGPRIAKAIWCYFYKVLLLYYYYRYINVIILIYTFSIKAFRWISLVTFVIDKPRTCQGVFYKLWIKITCFKVYNISVKCKKLEQKIFVKSTWLSYEVKPYLTWTWSNGPSLPFNKSKVCNFHFVFSK